MMQNKKNKIMAYLIFIILAFFPVRYLCANYIFSIDVYNAPITEATTKIKKPRLGLVAKRNFLGEGEFAKYSCTAANKLGWDCYVFKFRNSQFEPSENWKVNKKFLAWVQRIWHKIYPADVILYINPDMYLQALPNAKAVGVLDPGSIKHNIYSPYLFNMFDLILAYDSNETDQLSELTNKPLMIGWPSIYSTNFHDGKKQKLFFSGANVGTNRESDAYKEMYKILSNKDYTEIYGPKRAWSFLKNGYYGFLDSKNYNHTMSKAGIALLLHGDAHLERAVPSSRIFEAAANSMVIISDKHEFVQKHFEQCVFFIDVTRQPEQIANDIDNIVHKVIADPTMAQEKAKCSHDVFMKKFTLEQQLTAVFEKLHE